jgi:hypothetical protein
VHPSTRSNERSIGLCPYKYVPNDPFCAARALSAKRASQRTPPISALQRRGAQTHKFGASIAPPS